MNNLKKWESISKSIDSYMRMCNPTVNEARQDLKTWLGMLQRRNYLWTYNIFYSATVDNIRVEVAFPADQATYMKEVQCRPEPPSNSTGVLDDAFDRAMRGV